MSRYPLGRTVKAFRPFHCGGVELLLPGGEQVLAFSLWIDHRPNIGSREYLRDSTPDQLVAGEGTHRLPQMRGILDDLGGVLARADQVPVVVAGDFNSPSHQDWTEATARLNWDKAVRWPVSLAVERAGLVDAFREVHPDRQAVPDFI